MAELLSGLGRRAEGERGAGLVIALLVTLVVFSLGAVWIGLGTHQAIGSGREAMRERARNAAEAGLNAAMGRLTADPGWTGCGPSPKEPCGTLPGAAFEVTVLPVLTDPADLNRYIVAKGYAPSRDAPRRVARQLEHQVELVPTDGFRYALFTAPGGVTGANRMTVTGDIYSASDLLLSNNANISGSLISRKTITTSNNSTITGDVHALLDVTLNDAKTTVLGDVASGGSVSLTGRVKGSVQAAGTITGGTVDGSRAQGSPPPEPPDISLPTFSWPAVEAKYPLTAQTWLDPAAFEAHWLLNKDAFSGHHYVKCALPLPCVTPIALALKWKVVGDVTVVSEGPIGLSAEIINAAGKPVTITIVSLAPDPPLPLPLLPSIEMTNNISLPDDVRVLFFAPNGTARFKNLKHFSGAVYASNIIVDQQFTITFVPLAVTGFDWGPTSATHYEVRARTFREVPFSP